MSLVTCCLIEKDQKVKIDPFQSKNSLFQRAIQVYSSSWHCTSHQPSGTALPAKSLVSRMHCGFPAAENINRGWCDTEGRKRALPSQPC